MADDPIVFIDSGVGGLPYLEEARKYMPEENLVYVADNRNFPYGEKDVIELKRIILQLIEIIVDKVSPKLIIIVCNTASVVALSLLREKFGIPFVGVVPAVKPAAENSKNGIVGLIATRKTVEDPYTDTLINKFASGCRVEKYAGIDLVEFVENNYFTSTEEEKLKVVSDASVHLSNYGIDTLVLGCTHFVLLADYFKKYFGSSVNIIDSREGVRRQIQRIIKSESFKCMNKTGDIFYMTDNDIDQSNYIKFAKNFGLKWGGLL